MLEELLGLTLIWKMSSHSPVLGGKRGLKAEVMTSGYWFSQSYHQRALFVKPRS